MTDLNSWRTGAALSLTVATGYVGCAILFYAWPGAAMQFLNALFHGLDFGKLEPAAPFSALAFLCVLLIMMIWAFLMGALFACLHNWLGRKPANG